MPTFNETLTVNNQTNQPVIRLWNGKAILAPGAVAPLVLINGLNGSILLRGPEGQPRIHLDTMSANIWVGGNGQDGDIALFPSSGDNKTAAQASIRLDGEAGDIVLQNADCAEEFLARDEVLPPSGTVMVIDEGGALRPSASAYDKRVAGVISGAGGLRPGIVMGKQAERQDQAVSIALSGKVFCQADASFGAIEVGDLLASSPTIGHAMKAADREQAFGAVIGKALGSLVRGQGLVPILVALQ
jgi:hypothetical protein